ncbi:hypothetical protein [Ornithinimicrobium panacihumi]|uniref:hypothetical protein n=1 Tax=Ornithinimicrobium panacihumi TaxID=2008449 RepID=UPI003F8C9CE6
MAAESARDEEVASSERLVLREMLPSDASLLRELWESRDARTPPHRRITQQHTTDPGSSRSAACR